MKCERCGTKTATSHIISVVNGEKEEHHYCNECLLRGSLFGVLTQDLKLPFFDGAGGDYDDEFAARGEYDEGDDYDDDDVDDADDAFPDPQGFPQFLREAYERIKKEVSSSGKKRDGGETENLKSDEPEVFCSVCGISLKEILKTQKAGCAKCYQVFENVLSKKHQICFDGKKYCGKTYNPKLMSCDIDYLQNELNIAVKNQDYEQAAAIRDSINDAKKKILQKNASEANIE